MKKLQNRVRLVAAASALAGICFSAQAQITNGGFESNLFGWTTYGDVSTQPAAPAGAAQLFLTTAGLEADELDGAGALIGPFNASGVAAVDTGTLGGLEQLSGYAIGAFDAFGGFAYEGSLARQSFSAQAGDSLMFLWNFGTRETALDHAFVVIDGVVTSLSGPGLPTTPGNGFDLLQTGFQTFNTTFNSSGTHTVAFGVVDMGDVSVRSSLRIDQVQILAVPEPESWTLTLLGLVAMGVFARRARRWVQTR